MGFDRKLMTGSTDLMLLKLLERRDMYGYEIIEELRRRSNDAFDLKAGTLYPLLHQLTQKGLLTSWEQPAGEARTRRYYHITEKGLAQLERQEAEWRRFTAAVAGVLGGDDCALV